MVPILAASGNIQVVQTHIASEFVECTRLIVGSTEGNNQSLIVLVDISNQSWPTRRTVVLAP